MNKNDYCIIMAGGVGSRFWPLSRTQTPKQFIDILGTGQSLIQMTFDRFKQIIPLENIYVVTNSDYADLVIQHLPEIKKENILCEPLRKNTAPCIAYANHRIAAINPDASIVVAPSDHLIVKEVEFLRIIDKGLRFVSQDNTLLTLGIKPSRPETGYGYIQTKKGAPEKYLSENFHMVKIFTEKPNAEMAKVFCESGDFFWNSGIFFWSLAAIQKEFDTHLPDIQSLFDEGKNAFNTPAEAEFIKNIYSRCSNISIDYGLMEKAKNVFVLPADIGWSDLGTWGSMYEHSAKDKSRNVVNLKDQTFLYNVNECIINIPKDKLVVLQGLKNYIVVDSKDVLIVCRKDDEQLIKNYVNDVKMKYGDKYI
jgi:mannose-1-phosphate guanylyltransferase